MVKGNLVENSAPDMHDNDTTERSLKNSKLAAQSGNTYNDITIKAISPDNIREAQKLVELLTCYYGAGFPFEGVYDPEFWCAQSEELGIVSVVAECGGRFIGHIAIRPEVLRERYEVMCAAIHPDFGNDFINVASSFWDGMRKIADRQGWRVVYQLLPSRESQLHSLAVKYFESQELAILPRPQSIHGSQHESPEAFSLLCHHYNVMRSESVTLYPPQRHQRKIRELLSSIPGDRRFVEGGDISTDNEIATSPLETLGDLYVEYRNDRATLSRISLFPSAIDRLDCVGTELQHLANRERESGYQLVIRVDLTDPLCPKACDRISAAGFRFSGVSPDSDGTDFIVFSRFSDSDLKPLSFATPKMRSLKDYMIRSTQALR